MLKKYKQPKYLPLVLLLSSQLGFAAEGIFRDKNGDRPISYEIIDGDLVTEGDIIIGKASDLNNKSAIVVSSKSRFWPNGVLPYKISSSLSTTMRSRILQAMSILEGAANLKFVQVTSSNQSQYSNYVQFLGGSGCSAVVGKTGRGSQTIKLASNCNLYNTVHEIMHALGFWHEQSREDRDSYVRINWSNIQSGQSGNFNQHISDGNDFGAYDYDSVMHYGRTSFSRNGQPTIVPLQSGAKIGQRTHLSDKDIAALKAMYP